MNQLPISLQQKSATEVRLVRTGQTDSNLVRDIDDYGQEQEAWMYR